MEPVLIVFFCCAGTFLCYIRFRGDQPLSNGLRLVVAISKYVIAVMAATYLSAAIAALIAAPLLVFAQLAHTEAPTNLFSAFLDRPYFPFQTIVAFVAGFVATKWLREGKPVFVWVLPIAQFFVALLLVSSRHSAFQRPWNHVWSSFFNWDCQCSATLLQWKVMFPLYTSIAFSVAAYVWGAMRSAKALPSRASGPIA